MNICGYGWTFTLINKFFFRYFFLCPKIVGFLFLCFHWKNLTKTNSIQFSFKLNYSFVSLIFLIYELNFIFCYSLSPKFLYFICFEPLKFSTLKYHNQGDVYEKSMRYINMGFTGMFSVETVLKIIGFGVKVCIYIELKFKIKL